MESNVEDLKSKIIDLESRIKKIKVISLISTISGKTKIFADKMVYQFVSGFEEEPKHYEMPSLYWIFANLCYIIEKNCYLFLCDKGKRFLTNLPHLYDQAYVKNKDTYNNDNYEDINVLTVYYKDLIDRIMLWINDPNNNVSQKEIYLITNSMHFNSRVNEIMLAIYKNLKTNIHTRNRLSPFSKINLLEDNINSILFKTIIGGYFIQGNDEEIKDYNFYPDNQRPSFKKFIKSFEISNTLITQGMYIKFIEDGGYYKEWLWSLPGWEWREKNIINCPEYWFKKDSNWYKYHYDTIIDIGLFYNFPVTNISWYEADAFCKWVGGRLPLESEWEFCATNRGKTPFPWGTDLPCLKKCNIECEKINESNVMEYKKGNNLYGLTDMIGNAWEWCLDSYLPYSNFQMDLLNTSISYNNFSQKKKIIKGGSSNSSKFFINPQYREGIFPENRLLNIGFRVVKSL
ncbi:Sulfatase-modifying factor enzyme 1 [seawater metagenome]|uniref:Sulfatase-modifying factor enzyme 1 n=1 Tax=seawater metagenome TaxID=1561972 RepID=A0A5E8CLE1_9ZZZZ